MKAIVFLVSIAFPLCPRFCITQVKFISALCFIIIQGSQMWIFGMGLYLVRIAGDTMQLSAISGLATGLAIFFLGAFVGDWVDNTRRLKGEKNGKEWKMVVHY